MMETKNSKKKKNAIPINSIISARLPILNELIE